MDAPAIILPKLMPRERLIARIASMLTSLPDDEAFRIEIHKHKPTRSSLQNDALWGHIYGYILKHGGEAFGGWTKDDLHEAFLGECFGWVVVRTPLGTRKKPKRRSKKLNKQEFADYIHFIQTTMEKHGMIVPDPDPNWRDHVESH